MILPFAGADLARAAAGGGALILFSLAPIWALRRGGRFSVRAFWAGAAGFLLFVELLEGGMHRLMLAPGSPAAGWMEGKPWLYVTYICLAAGIFEEGGRAVLFRFWLAKEARPALSCGLGHGAAEIWLRVALPTLTLAGLGAWCVFRGEQVPPEILALTGRLADFSASYTALLLAERAAALLLHLALSVLVYRAVRRRRPGWGVVAVLLHGLADLPPALYQCGLISLVGSEAGFCLAAAAAVLLAWKTGRQEEA